MERDTYVRATPVVRPMIVEPPPPPPPIDLAAAFQSQEGANEVTSGWDRSIALVVRLIPFSAVWLVLTYGIVWKFGLERIDGVLIFSVITAYTCYRLDRNERYDSKHGVEHHRIDSATYLTERQMELEQENRRAMTQAYIRYLEGEHDNTRRIGD